MLKWFRVRAFGGLPGVHIIAVVLTLDTDGHEQVIRDLELLPEFGGQNWSAVFLQKFEGSVTIWPKSRCTCEIPPPLSLRRMHTLSFFRHTDPTLGRSSPVKDWTRLLTDPDRDELARMIRVGQGVTWPKVRL